MPLFIKILKRIYILLLVSNSWQSVAQDANSESTKKPGEHLVELDLGKGIVKDSKLVPFDVRLRFTAALPDQVDPSFGINDLDELFMFQREGVCPALPSDHKAPSSFGIVSSWTRPPSTYFGTNNAAEFPWLIRTKDMLRPNRAYCLLIRRNSDLTKIDPGQQTVSLRTASKFSDYVKLDFGLGYAFKPKALVATLAIHGYLIPINDDTDLAEPFSFGRQFLLRTSFFAGIAPITFSSNTRSDIEPATAVGNFIFGVGIRAPFYFPTYKTPDKRIRGKFLLQSMRLNAGFMLFKQPNANPVLSDSRSKVTPYVSLTYDLNLLSLLGPIAKLFGAG